MTKRLFLLMSIFVFSLLFSCARETFAQSRKSVSAAEVNGTFRDYFSGKFKGHYNEIKVLTLGKGKLKISFRLIYPFIDGTGGMMANFGEAEGEAIINGDTAIYTDSEFADCRITIKFVRPGTIKIDQSGADSQCGFGLNVSATGTYKKTSRAKPKF